MSVNAFTIYNANFDPSQPCKVIWKVQGLGTQEEMVASGTAVSFHNQKTEV